MTEATLKVPEIHCGHCKMSIESALALVGGVDHAKVDVGTSTVSVAYAPPATLKDIVAAIEAQGYEVPAPG